MNPSRTLRRTQTRRRIGRPESNLRVEKLEGRVVLSANLGIELRRGSLVVTGTEAADTVVVNQPSRTTITVSLNRAAPQSFRASAVRSVVFNGLGGDDSFANNTAVPSKVDGGTGDDTLSGGRAADELRGGDGQDRIFGNRGNDAVYGGSGDDLVEGGDGNDREYGEDGADALHGGRGRDLLFGGRDNDDLFGDEGSDDLHGEDGDDHLDGCEGRDRIRGGAGRDREDDSDDRFEDGDDDGDGHDNDHDRPGSPALTTPIEFDATGLAQLTGTVGGEDSRRVYSFTATTNGTVSATLLPGGDGRYAEVEAENRATGTDVLELSRHDHSHRTSGSFAVVAGQTYVFEIESPFKRSGVGFTLNLQLG